jgi:16S rRNA (guanine(966)-N(2))-methyltransferase RsmD
LRIIAGRYKGHRLRPVEGHAVRSTADRVRESLFNILAAEIPGTDVLDLFCGAGTLGLEALSRGADHATFVDKSRRSVRRTQDNSDALRVLTSVEIMNADAMAAIRAFSRNEARFDLIFADPPYGDGWGAKLLASLAESGILNADGILVLEHHKKEDLGATPQGFSVWTQRRFGDTMFTIWRWQPPVSDSQAHQHPTAGEE